MTIISNIYIILIHNDISCGLNSYVRGSYLEFKYAVVSVNMPDPIQKHFGYGQHAARISQQGSDRMQPACPLPVSQFQFQTLLRSSIDTMTAWIITVQNQPRSNLVLAD